MGSWVSLPLQIVRLANSYRRFPGYSKAASPVQVPPHKAPIITQPIRGIAMSVRVLLESKVVRDKLTVYSGFLGNSNGVPLYDRRGRVHMERHCF